MLNLVIQLVPIGIIILFIFGFIRYQRRKNKYSPFTEKFLRLPGATLQAELDEKVDSILHPFMLVWAASLVCALKWNTVSMTFNIILIAFVVITLTYVIFKLKKTFKQALNLRLGLEGEIYTGQELNYLMREGAWVYHDIPYKYGNIDHIVVSTGGVFVIETKAVRKPAGQNRRADYKVVYENGVLKFPHATTKKPLEQAQRHADYLNKFLKKHMKVGVKVFPVVALPGWYVDVKKSNSAVLVVNPKRGSALSKRVKAQDISERDAAMIAEKVESYARDVVSSSEISNPDAAKKYDLLSNRRSEKRQL